MAVGGSRRCETGRAIALIAITTFCAACSSSPFYRGDGTISRGLIGAVIDLGPIDLTRPGHYSFNMTGLSESKMVIGFRTAQRHLDAVVHLAMTNDADQIVVDEEGELQSWVWEEPGYFVYRTGTEHDIPISSDTAINVSPLNGRADQGWGTYFTPVTKHRYQLQVEVLRAATVPSPESRLTVESLRTGIGL